MPDEIINPSNEPSQTPPLDPASKPTLPPSQTTGIKPNKKVRVPKYQKGLAAEISEPKTEI